MSLVKVARNQVVEAARRAGFVVKRRNIYTDDAARLVNYLKIHRVDTVIDVGAHKGDYAIALLEAGFEGKIYSFEALPDLHAALSLKAALFSRNWLVAPRSAITDFDGLTELNVTAQSASSSILTPSDAAIEHSDIFSVIDRVISPAKMLRTALAELGVESKNIFLKLDIQGGEAEAISGCAGITSRIIGISSELPNRVYYQGQKSMYAVDEMIRNLGFELWDILPGWRQPTTGRIVHFDATYFRPEPSDK